jgi:hypothetical protein
MENSEFEFMMLLSSQSFDKFILQLISLYTSETQNSDQNLARTACGLVASR